MENLTESSVHAWLTAKASSYNLPGLVLKIETGHETSACIARIDGDYDAFGCGESFDNAVTRLKADLKSDEQRAAELREKAAKLLADAEKLLADAEKLSPVATT